VYIQRNTVARLRIVNSSSAVINSLITISYEESAVMAMECHRQQWNVLRSSCKVPNIFTRS